MRSEEQNSTNMAEEPDPSRLCGHVAVCLEHRVLVFGGWDFKVSQRTIWAYNLYIEKWRKHEIPRQQRTPPSCYRACAVAIGADVYMFDGRDLTGRPSADDALWKLASRSPEGNMFWSRIVIENNMQVPSYRQDHSGWAYQGKLWVFGGVAELSAGQYHKFGQFSDVGHFCRYTNQFLCFDPSNTEWTNPNCTGSVPIPRRQHATTLVNDKVWLYGGKDVDDRPLDDLYELDMCSLVWTQIQTPQPTPQVKWRTPDAWSLNAFTQNKLLLHEGRHMWILDLQSKSWKKHHQSPKRRNSIHAGVTGLHSHVTIIGGTSDDTALLELVMFEPRSLQQLAMQSIDKHRTSLNFECLPNKLIDQLE